MTAALYNPTLLPPPLKRDLNLRAQESLAAELRMVPIENVVIYDFDNVSASALVHLAEQFNILEAGWELATTEAQKRALLKEAIALHRIKGTRYAVTRSLELLGVVANVIEWWEEMPMAAPFTFRVFIDPTAQPAGSPALDGVRMAQIFKAVTFWKNVRSHYLLDVELDSTMQTAWVGIGNASQWLDAQHNIEPIDLIGQSPSSWAAVGNGNAWLETSNTISL